jgi:multicomponent Na+:H+ antiporter subunit F
MMEFDGQQYILWLTFGILLSALLLAFVRLVKGPAASDRIVALDLVAAISMAFILVYSVSVNNAVYFDVAIIISLVTFIGTVALSTYIKKKK